MPKTKARTTMTMSKKKEKQRTAQGRKYQTMDEVWGRGMDLLAKEIFDYQKKDKYLHPEIIAELLLKLLNCASEVAVGYELSEYLQGEHKMAPDQAQRVEDMINAICVCEMGPSECYWPDGDEFEAMLKPTAVSGKKTARK
jgi:hypothetical protein